ncbi:hypothetical protein [Bdellovibrio sp. GT3]|uniref:hypothetical protein n=1 Tax=Bdellovibrio sp. GT3 TaxID=3136282 RepID=UPI0030F08825
MSHKIHFRRCQHCGETHNTSDELIIDCESCGKELIPLYYTQLVKIAQDELNRSPGLIRDNPVMKEIVVVGLTADWDPETEAF